MGINALEELYALFSEAVTVDSPATEADEDEQNCICWVADGAVAAQGKKTLQFQGQFMGQSVLILLDSGSSSSFASAQLLSSLSIPTMQCAPLSVRVANGEVMQCTSFVPAATWAIQQYQFQHDLRCYLSWDMI